MIKFKKQVLALLVVLISILLTACANGNDTTEQGYVLPDLSGKTRENYQDTLNSPLITIIEKETNHDTIPVDEFVEYGGGLSIGDEIDPGTMVYVYFSLGPVIVDTEKPVISGVEDIEIPYASEFDSLDGVTVIDNVDGDLTHKLVVTGTYDLFEIGEYILTYSVTDGSNNLQQVERTITVVPNEIDTRYTDELEIDFEYAGKSFIEDKVGVVTLERCTDGDTAKFRDSTGVIFDLRFLGVDTPESTPIGGYDPWGKAASDFTCNVLTNANIIVIEGEGNHKEGYGRYLGWVWVDGRLLNLELVERAYTEAKISNDFRYFEIFFNAERKTKGTGRRVWGEIDPNFDYS